MYLITNRAFSKKKKKYHIELPVVSVKIENIKRNISKLRRFYYLSNEIQSIITVFLRHVKHESDP